MTQRSRQGENEGERRARTVRSNFREGNCPESRLESLTIYGGDGGDGGDGVYDMSERGPRQSGQVQIDYAARSQELHTTRRNACA